MYRIEKKDFNIYLFDTDNQISYLIYFKPTPYILGDENLVYADNIFEFIIQLASQNDQDIKVPYDSIVGDTIAFIVKDFFNQNNELITIYVCDSSDNRQLVRAKKFNDWFYKYYDGTLSKLDEKILDKNGTLFPFSLIIRSDNPYKGEILDKFSDLALAYSK
jgi:hypothetical protein